ncbi:acyltransferase domain-containing protein [Luteococcus sp.]|uniref:acyltransferase domain-containing protein n=1 Tax=Luteococcus sp. TaxID=1969402 RepID=UPI003734DD65
MTSRTEPTASLLSRLCDEDLARLGVQDEDRPAVLSWAAEVATDETDLARVELLVERLAGVIGHSERSAGVFEAVDEQHRLGRGVLAVLALVLAAPGVREALARRQIASEVIDATLADLGWQVHKDRQVNGSTGLHNLQWMAMVWAGRFLKLGRLQFELTTSDVGILETEVPALAIHIDPSGPLHPELVDDSLRQATLLFEEHYPEVGPIDWFTCTSWLLDPGIAWRLGEGNVVDFARRFAVWKVTECDRDGLYFGFDIEPDERPLAQQWATLEAHNRVQEALLAHWRDGEHVVLASGRLPVISSELSEPAA